VRCPPGARARRSPPQPQSPAPPLNSFATLSTRVRADGRVEIGVRSQTAGKFTAEATAVAALAALVQGQGRLDEAEQVYRRALTVFERALGPEHYELAVNFNNLGVLQAARGEERDARAPRESCCQHLGPARTPLAQRFGP